MKVCRTCKQEKPLEEFSFQKVRGRRYFFLDCKKCRAAASVMKRHGKPEKYRAQVRKSLLKRRYGITPADYNRMLQNQGHKCAICKTEGAGRSGAQRLAVDHDHKTGATRGLLCHRCNIGLGHFFDTPELIRNALKYLQKHIVSQLFVTV
jgi:hypothetical protein